MISFKNFKEAFEPHMMYDPKTGKGYKADKEEDHLRMKKLGYSHDKPETNTEAIKPYISSMDGNLEVLDAKGKVAFTTKDRKEAEKFLKINYKMLMNNPMGYSYK